MPAKNKYETLFFNALRDLFVGAKVEGDSGYINLMKIKAGYFENGVSGKLHGRINEVLLPFPDFREELFDKLYTFFQRYFSESGSIYFRHTAVHQNVYEKVYTDDRDVVLFWKTHMLYYVKTDRIFNSMGVEMDGFKFYFDAGKMTLKKSNEKRETIYAFREVDQQGQLVFEVTYSEKGRKTRMDDILKNLKKSAIKINDETLTKAFRVFEKQSEVDYFINKDARSFLREQFDIWLYQYLFAGQNIWTQDRLAQLQALKEIAFNIIDFISQFEDELVKVWNKPKFVRNSHYVITLDKLMAAAGEDEKVASRAAAKQADKPAQIAATGKEHPSRNDIFERILAHPQFEQQLQEWRELGMLGADFRLGMLTEKDLTGAPVFPQYQYLPLDTKYFPDLELDILALFDDLDAALDGWLVHSENYQALNTMLSKFHTKVKSIYIDPPYNTDASEIIYENNYKDAAWITLIENRLSLAKQMLSRNGILCATIDDFELSNLRSLISTVFTENHFVGTIAIRNKITQPFFCKFESELSNVL
ncbi:MAG: DNA methyltransferase [Bellilinea sp.]